MERSLSTASVAPSSAASSTAAADAMGRGTPAGRLLHALYGGNKINGRSAGERYSRGNRDVRSKLASQGVSAPSPRQVEAHARREKILERLCTERKAERLAPRLGTFQSRYGWIGYDDIPMAQRSRPSVRIVDQKALKAEYERENAPPQPGQVLGAKATERLQLQMEWARRGQVPAGLHPDAPRSAFRREKPAPKLESGPQAALQQAQELFDDVAKEIEERELFLAEIAAKDPARAVELKSRIEGEISQRHATLRKLDARIREEEDKALAEQHQHQQGLSRRQDGGLCSR